MKHVPGAIRDIIGCQKENVVAVKDCYQRFVLEELFRSANFFLPYIVPYGSHCTDSFNLNFYNIKKATIMDNKGAIVPASQVPEATSKTFEQVSISKNDGLICKGHDQTDGECDNYYIG